MINRSVFEVRVATPSKTFKCVCWLTSVTNHYNLVVSKLAKGADDLKLMRLENGENKKNYVTMRERSFIHSSSLFLQLTENATEMEVMTLCGDNWFRPHILNAPGSLFVLFA